MTNVCLVDDCDREAIAKGACMKHYQRMRKTGSYELAPRVPYERKPADKKLCSVDECDSPTKGRGMCNRHYQRFMANGTTDAVRVPRKNLGECSFPGCSDRARQNELCYGHLAQYRKGYLRTKRDDLPPRLCGFEGCGRKHSHNGWCAAHAAQQKRGATMRPIGQRRVQFGRVTQHGYVEVFRPEHPNARKSGWLMEHVVVMTEVLGRALFPRENVHHLNGVRDDNRPENLELWTTHQPHGQRVVDKIAWAIEFLNQYRADLARARA